MKPISNELIQKYLDGKCTAVEEQAVIRWYNTFENRHDPYSDLTADERQEMSKRMLSNIESGIQIDKPRINFRRIIYLTAAAAVILLVVNYRFFLFTPPPSNQSSIKDNKSLIVANATHAMLKKVLPDQSTVWLSPGAKIQYEANFQNNRVIRLTGESFFEVTRDKQHPFVVYSRHVTTKVWGTSFRIRDHNYATSAEVAVVTGKVSVKVANGAGKEVMLLPKQRVVYENDDPELHIRNVDKTTALEMWKKTDLVFDKVTLKEVIELLNKEFDVRITLNNESLSNLEMQADFNHQSLPDIMIMLCKLTGCTYTTDGKHFELVK